MNSKLMIGWSEADITPVTEKSISLYGQYYSRLTKEIHSRLKTVAVAFSSGDAHFLMASMDSLDVAEPFQKLVRDSVVKMEPSIDPATVFINAIHSHSAPSTFPPVVKKAADGSVAKTETDPNVLSAGEYVDFTVPIVAQNLVNAWKNRQAGGVARAFGFARVGHCRRAVYANGKAEMYGDTTREDFIGMEAGEDSGVDMLFTFDETGKKTGLILNVACPSQIMESTYKISSDFAGATRELLKKDFGKDFHTLYQISPAGCQSPRDLVRHYTAEPDFWHEDGVVEMSNRLRTAVLNADIGKIDYTPVFKQKSMRVTLPRRRASYTDYKKAQAELARLTAVMPLDQAKEEFGKETHANEKLNGPGPYDSKLHHMVLIMNEQAVIRRYENQDKIPTISFDMNVARIGDAAFASNPFELYLYYGQNIKARSKAQQTFLVQLCSGASIYPGYLPSPDAEKFGGYGGLIINGQVGSGGGFMLADITVKEINRLFE